MRLEAIAARIAASNHESLERPGTEYSVRTEIIFSAEFEGQVAKDVFLKKVEFELMSALESSIKVIARELHLRPGRVLVKPLKLDVAINDQGDFEEVEEEQAE
jgi:hypothetical protein